MAWRPLGNSRDSLRKPSQVERIINFIRADWGNFHAHDIFWGWEWYPVFDWRGKPAFDKHLKRSLPSEIGMCERLCVFCLNYNKPRDAQTQKKVGFPCSAINAGSSFISQDEGMSESPVETIEKAIVLNLFWKEGLTSIWDFESCAEFSASKGDDAWFFMKIDRNTNITVATNREAWPPCSSPEESVFSCQA